MKIRDKLGYESKPKPISFRPTDSLQAALDVMVERNIGSVIITDDAGHVEGILTERDLMNRVLHPKKDPQKLKISDVMTAPVRVAYEDDNLVDWIRIMSNNRFRHLPVVDQDQKLVSVMSQGDFVSYTWPDLLDRAKEDIKKRFGTPFQLAMVLAAAAIIIYMAIDKL